MSDSGRRGERTGAALLGACVLAYLFLKELDASVAHYATASVGGFVTGAASVALVERARRAHSVTVWVLAALLSPFPAMIAYAVVRSHLSDPFLATAYILASLAGVLIFPAVSNLAIDHSPRRG